MPPRRSVPPSAQAAASTGDGCLSGFALPPLAVLVVGGLLAFLAFSSQAAPLSPVAGDALVGNTPVESQSDSPLAPFFAPPVQYWADDIVGWSVNAGLDPNLAATVMQIESCGHPTARSGSGAMGLFQVMPFHFAVGEDPFDPGTNARRGLAYLQRSMQAAAGDVRLAFAGYNGGVGVIAWDESAWAAETRRYAYWAEGIYADARAGAAVSPRLQEWLEAGGASLCRQASHILGLVP